MWDDELCYQAIRSKDPRFDGWFFTGVTSTGIYCRPSCPAVTPKRAHVRFFRSAAAAQGAGFRACRRCRPDAVPGSPEWNQRADVVGRAMRLIADGAVDRDGVAGLAAGLGYSERQLHRLLVAELGAGPQALARAQRAQTARVLLETTALPVSDVAFGAGFASIRQFNDTVRAVFAATPTELRQRAGRQPTADGAPLAGLVRLRLPYRPPLDADGLLEFFACRAVPGVEEVVGGRYRRVLTLAHGIGVVDLALRTSGSYVECTLRLADLRDVTSAVQRCRRMLDLDTDPLAVDEALAGDPLLGPLVAAVPGRRLPGSADPVEFAVRAVIGQQVSVAAARTVAARLAEWYGTPLDTTDGGLARAFPTAAALAEADTTAWPMPQRRRRALQELACAVAEGRLVLDPGADWATADAHLQTIPGIGPWTAAAIRMRGLGDPDVFLAEDLGARRALGRLGAPDTPTAAAALAERWRPWRSYALHHLWSVPAVPPAAPAPAPSDQAERGAA